MTHEAKLPQDDLFSLHPETIEKVDETIDLNGTREYLETLKLYATPTYEEEVARTAFDISRAVHNSLRFHYDPKNPPQITPEAIRETGTTTCYGFTNLTSEALEAAGVEHWVAYANNHGFILVPQYEKGTTLFLNPSDPRLDGEISPHQAHFQPQAIREALTEKSRTGAWFSSELYARFSKGMMFTELLGSDSNDWLTLEDIKELTYAKCYSDRGSSYLGRHKEKELRQLVTSIYTPQDGREVLQNYGQFQHFVMKGDTSSALAHFKALEDTYPEIDIRNDQHFFMKLLMQLAVRGMENEAYESIDQLHTNLSQTQNPLADIIRADYTRFFGHASGSEPALERAMELYKQAENARNSDMIQGKTRRVAAIIKGLSLAKQSETVTLESANA